MWRRLLLSILVLGAMLAVLALSLRGRGYLRPNAWEEQIQAFEQSDRKSPPPPNGILFVGGSSFARWTNLDSSFPGHPVLARGFGGAHLSDIVYYARRIVLPYKPKEILVYAGDNDLASGRRAEDVVRDFRTFAAIVRGALPSTKITFLSVKPSPSRAHLSDEQDRLNGMIEAYCRDKPGLCFVDVRTPLLGPRGELQPEYYVADGVHLSPAAYQVWGRVLGEHLDHDRLKMATNR